MSDCWDKSGLYSNLRYLLSPARSETSNKQTQELSGYDVADETVAKDYLFQLYLNCDPNVKSWIL